MEQQIANRVLFLKYQLIIPKIPEKGLIYSRFQTKQK